jgi:hypothetical protein
MRVEGWSMLLAAHGLTPGCDEPQRIEGENGLVGYKARAFIRDNMGRDVGGAWGMVTVDERNWRGKPEFQLMSMAQTRAVAKAARLALGHVVALLKIPGLVATPLEEMEFEESAPVVAKIHQEPAPVSPPIAGPAPGVRGPHAPATTKQLGMISAMVSRIKSTRPEIQNELRQQFGDPGTFDREQASAVISHLQGLQNG